MGETTTRLASTHSRSRNGVNIGGGGGVAGTRTPLCRDAWLGEPAIHGGDERGIARLEILVAQPQAARQQAEGELGRLEPAVIALGLLEPLEAGLRRALQRLHLRPPLGLVRGQRGLQIAMLAERPRQGDRVFHGQLGARADREVRGVRGVAEQHHVVVMPARVVDRGEAAPQRAVLEHGMAAQLPGEELLGEGHRLVLAGPVEPGPPPRLLRGFQDERGGVLLVAIRVHTPEAEVRLLEDEREGRERKRGPEPDEAVRTPVDPRLELRGEMRSGPRSSRRRPPPPDRHRSTRKDRSPRSRRRTSRPGCAPAAAGC